LQPLATVEIGGKLGAGEKAQVLGFGFPASAAHGNLAHFKLKGGGTVCSGGEEQAGNYELLVRLQVTLIVFCGVGRATEEADEGIASGPSSIGPCNSRLDSRNVGGQGGRQFHTRPINAVPGTCPSTNQPV